VLTARGTLVFLLTAITSGVIGPIMLYMRYFKKHLQICAQYILRSTAA
jgi:hypothetical protein